MIPCHVKYQKISLNTWQISEKKMIQNLQVQKLEGDNVKVTDTSLILCNHKENET